MNKKFFIPIVTLLSFSGYTFSQSTPPDVGDVYQSTRPSNLSPLQTKGVKIFNANGGNGNGNGNGAVIKNGPEALVNDVSITGNTVFSSEVLKAQIKDMLGKNYNIEGMRSIARKIRDFYRAEGYPFARVVIPQQSFKEGLLNLTVLEGRYGVVKATGETELVEGVTPYLEKLKPGEIIEGALLEDTVEDINNLAGIQISPTMSPGKEVGTGDLLVHVDMESKHGGEAGIDNAGSRYTGEYRAHVDYFMNSSIAFADRLGLSAMVTDEGLWFGSIDYEKPFGTSGFHAGIGYARTGYQLGKEYTSFDATGMASIFSAQFSYSIYRSPRANLHFSATFQHKVLEEEFASLSQHQHKYSQALPIVLAYDYRDSLAGGGVTYGNLVWTPGVLHLDTAATAQDIISANKRGWFNKVNLDIARIQNLPENFVLYARVAAQWADSNLDASERLGLGGIDGVRAYPVGEGNGDVGVVAQVELRYKVGDYTPYAFYDVGSADINYRPWDLPSHQSRDISGAGLGIRGNYMNWFGNLAIAWRGSGGAPQSDSVNHNWRILFSLNRSF
jgi:hemolysin activation/secretion protein